MASHGVKQRFDSVTRLGVVALGKFRGYRPNMLPDRTYACRNTDKFQYLDVTG